MPRPRTPAPSLELFDTLTLADAIELARVVPVGCKLVQDFRRCRGACCKAPSKGHGPYWFARVGGGPGGRGRKYVGQEAARARLERAWELVRVEIRRLEREAVEDDARKTLGLRIKGDVRARTRRLAELVALVRTPADKAGPKRARSQAIPIYELLTGSQK